MSWKLFGWTPQFTARVIDARRMLVNKHSPADVRKLHGSVVLRAALERGFILDFTWDQAKVADPPGRESYRSFST